MVARSDDGIAINDQRPAPSVPATTAAAATFSNPDPFSKGNRRSKISVSKSASK